jgi:hypothetical protein
MHTVFYREALAAQLVDTDARALQAATVTAHLCDWYLANNSSGHMAHCILVVGLAGGTLFSFCSQTTPSRPSNSF